MAIALNRLILVSILTLSALAAAPSASAQLTAPQTTVVEIPIELEGIDRVELKHKPNGDYLYRLHSSAGVRELSPAQFTIYINDAHLDRPFIRRLFNISGTAGILWVAFGFIAQLMFTARMIVQWITSEKHKDSVVPVAFWWLSLAGGVMLLIYFVWRKDIVGVSGQMIGVVIYARNLILISRRPPSPVRPA